MKHIYRFRLGVVYLCFFIFLCGCSSSLENLGESKKKVTAYYQSERYKNELKEVIDDAIDELSSVKVEDSSAVIFDVDETALSNYRHIKDEVDFGYVPELWNKWILKAEATAIDDVKRLYDRLIERKFHVIFITGRTEGQYDATYKNLVNAGYTKFDTLIVRTERTRKSPAADFKNIERIVLVGMGYKIAACVGDQWSDMAGENTGLKIRIPNYLYMVD